MSGSHDTREAHESDVTNPPERSEEGGETDRKRSAGARLRELQRENERLNELLDVLGHDLRNHLAVAKGRLDLARDERDDEHLASVARSHDRMEELLDDLLAARDDGFGVGDGEPVSLEACAQRAWETVEAGNAELDVESDLEFRADRQRLSQLLENLFRNAVEHGSIHPQLPLTVTVGPLPDGSGFYVEDDGRGLPSTDRERLFDEGFSTTEDGTGLGLAIVGDVVSGHGWTVEAAEGPAGGARFEIAGVEQSTRVIDVR